jgi:hypothetical protein
MNIIFGKENVTSLDDRYMVLELDTMQFPNSDAPVTAYCVMEQIPLDEMLTITQFTDLHHNLMINYRLKNWKYCRDAIEHLQGKWRGEMDSFYNTLLDRIKDFEIVDPGDNWTGIVTRN